MTARILDENANKKDDDDPPEKKDDAKDGKNLATASKIYKE